MAIVSLRERAATISEGSCTFRAKCPAEVDLYRHPITVEAESVDELGHASNIAYVKWLQDAAVAHSTSLGLSFARYLELGGVFVVRRHEIDYLRPSLRGDRLEVRTHIASVQAAKSERRYEIVRLADEQPVVRAMTLWGFVDTTTGRPTRIPSEVYKAFGLERVTPPR